MRLPVFRVAVRPGRHLPWGLFWAEYPYGPGSTPRRRSKFFATEADAQTAKRLALAALAGTAPAPPLAAPPPDTTRLGGFLTVWLRDHIQPIREAATYAAYEGLVRRHITPALGRVALTDEALTVLRVRGFYEELYRAGVALPTRRHVHAVLRSAIMYAKAGNLLRYNPCEGLGAFLRHRDEPDGQPQPNPFSPEEAGRLLAQLDAQEHERWQVYFRVLHDTGIRVGEAAALKWVHLQLEKPAGQATIAQSYSVVARADKSTKTRRVRVIDLTSDLITRLRAWRQTQRIDSLRRGRSVPVYVLTNGRGSPCTPDSGMRAVFDRTCQACALPGHTPHDLRDTFATTHLVQDWGKLGWVSEQLGHRDTVMTQTRYYRFKATARTAHYADDIRRG